MRSRLLIGAGILLLISRVGMAQTPAKPQPQAPVAPGPTVPSLGSIDFGFRGTDTDIDGAALRALSRPSKRRDILVPYRQGNGVVFCRREGLSTWAIAISNTSSTTSGAS